MHLVVMLMDLFERSELVSEVASCTEDAVLCLVKLRAILRLVSVVCFQCFSQCLVVELELLSSMGVAAMRIVSAVTLLHPVLAKLSLVYEGCVGHLSLLEVCTA